MERFFATYLVETPLPVQQAAEVLAGEQSSGTFVRVPGETKQLRDRFGAKVERITELATVNKPTLPGNKPARGKFNQARLIISWPVGNVGKNLPTLVSTVQGNLYELPQFSGLKLLDLDFPSSFVTHFRGPAFGVAGTRRLTRVQGRPLLGTIIKPSIGLTPAQTARLVKTLANAGVDFIKDDELMANPPHSPFGQRLKAVMRVINEHAERTGKRVMYAFNISDEINAMRHHYDDVTKAGGTAVMMSLNSVGLSAAKLICDQGALAIHGHRNGWGMLTRHPYLGIEFSAYQKLWRLAGVDQLHVNGIKNKFWESDDSVVHSIAVCLEPIHSLGPILPVVSSGQWGGQAPETYRRTKTVDLVYLAGGGIMAHPDGASGGVKALRQAWDAAVSGVPLHKAAQKHAELRHSLEKFGGKSYAPSRKRMR